MNEEPLYCIVDKDGLFFNGYEYDPMKFRMRPVWSDHRLLSYKSQVDLGIAVINLRSAGFEVEEKRLTIG